MKILLAAILLLIALAGCETMSARDALLVGLGAGVLIAVASDSGGSSAQERDDCFIVIRPDGTSDHRCN